MGDRPKRIASSLGDAHHAALGRLTAEFALTEMLLHERLIRMAGVDHRIGWDVFSGLGVRGVIQTIRLLVKRGDSSASRKEDHLAILARAEAVCESRNRLLHSFWGGERLRIGMRDMIGREVSVAEIDAVSDEIRELNADLVYGNDACT